MSILLPKVFWPLTITAANKAIPLHNTTTGNVTANITEGVYTSAEALRADVQTQIRASNVFFILMDVIVSSTGIFTFDNTPDNAAFKFRWGAAPSPAGAILGFTATDTAVALIQVAEFQHSNGWYAPHPPTTDSLPIRDRGDDTVTLTKAGQTKYISESELVKRRLVFKFLAPEFTYSAFEDTTAKTNRAIERWWDAGRAQFRYWPDGLTEATYYDYAFDLDTIHEFKTKRQFTNKALYEVELGILGYVA